MRVIGPDHQWIAEEELLALANFLERLEHELHQMSGELRKSEHWWSSSLEGRLEGHQWPEVSGIRYRVERTSAEVARVRQALWRYAEDTARQERARIDTFESARDWFLALFALTMASAHTQRPLAELGISDAASALLPADWSPEFPSVTLAYESRVSHPPRGIADRIQRIPSGQEPPIRIERYREGAEWHTEVFIAGTRDLSVGETPETFDMESNLALVAGLTATSLIAVQSAMAKAGVRAGDNVTFVGHSQGGLIAARLAQSGAYNTTGLLTVGAPLGTAPLRGDFPAVAIAHSDDPVPTLGGALTPSGVIRIETPSGALPGDLEGQHSLESYLKTAKAVEESPSAEMLDAFPEARGRGRALGYRAERD